MTANQIGCTGQIADSNSARGTRQTIDSNSALSAGQAIVPNANGALNQEAAYPDFTECRALWKKYKTPPHVIGHCKAVSATASAIGKQLNQHGYQLNIPLIEAAGWLHDIARIQEYHWNEGADIAVENGYPDVADVIRVHMKYRIDGSKEDITATDLICLADRLVKEDRYVGPGERMNYIIAKAKGEPGAEERIRASYCEIRRLKQRIEQIIGITLEKLMESDEKRIGSDKEPMESDEELRQSDVEGRRPDGERMSPGEERKCSE